MSWLFQSRYLLATNLGVSFVLSGLGDALQQKWEAKEFGQVNVKRSLHMSASFGLTSGLLCHYWYIFLDRALPGSALRVVAQKIVVDQILFSPVCISACLTAAGILEGSHRTQIAQDVVEKGVQLYVAEWLLWPPAQFVNFYFLSTKYRVVFDNAVSLVYDVYTSQVKHQSPKVRNRSGPASS